jgi:photosystem II stability/assembly factor-like uncharacterized protein
MRTTLAFVMVVLSLSLGQSATLAQTGAGWLSSFHMFDALTGWAVDTEGWGGVGARGAESSVVRTTDGGIHWRDVTPHAPAGQQIYRSGFWVGWLSPLSAWISTDMGPQNSDPLGRLRTPVLFTTVNGGAKWKSVPLPLGGNIVFINARDGWLVNDDTYRSTDGGEKWIRIGSVIHRSFTFGITFLDTMTGWIAASSGAKEELYHFVTHDGGRTWQQQKLQPPSLVTTPWYLSIGDSHTFFNSLDGLLPVVYGTNTDAGVLFYFTHDGGTTWTPTTPVTLHSYRTVNGGLMPTYRSSSFADANHGWVTDGDALYVTSDGGRQWATIQPDSHFAYVQELDFISPQIGWAMGQPLNTPFLLKTVDGGRAWSPVAYTISP